MSRAFAHRSAPLSVPCADRSPGPRPISRGGVNNRPDPARRRLLGAQGGSHAFPFARQRAPSSASAAVASPCPAARPAAARGRPSDRRARLRRRRLPRLRRPHAGAPRPALERGERPVPAGARRRRRARQLAAAADPQRRGAAGPHRARPQRPPRAPDRARARVAAGLHRAPGRPPRAGLPDARAGLDELDVELRRRPAPRLRRRDRRRARARVEGAPRARAVRRDGGEDRGPHPPRRVLALLALADRSASTRSTGTR